jgi:hypothetical protein
VFTYLLNQRDKHIVELKGAWQSFLSEWSGNSIVVFIFANYVFLEKLSRESFFLQEELNSKQLCSEVAELPFEYLYEP